MKNNILILLFTVLSLASCSEYQKVLQSDSDSQKYKMAEQLYEQGLETGRNRFIRKSLRLQEQIIDKYRGKAQGQKLSYLYANTYYILNDFINAGYQFERFTKSYPKSPKYEEALFKSAKSYYELSPRYSLSQEDTEKAMSKLQLYLNIYPEGKYAAKANEYIAELQTKLEKKYYEIAKQYHHREMYKAAIEALDNFILDFPGSVFRQKAYYYKFESAYLLAINSYKYLQEERLKTADEYYNKFIKEYPKSVFAEQANKYSNDIKERLESFKSTES